jgi:predicted RNase H-like nuclease (RuvC/YqgF family)
MEVPLTNSLIFVNDWSRPKIVTKISGSKEGTEFSFPWKKSKHEQASPKKAKEGGKWCEYHETDTHNTKECHVIKKMAKDKAKKELNALRKKVSKMQKNLEEATKPKRSADESDDEVNALTREIEDVDMQLAMLDSSENKA